MNSIRSLVSFLTNQLSYLPSKMPYGQCNVDIVGNKCPCPAGKEAPGQLASDSLCVNCQHKLVDHVCNSKHSRFSDSLPHDIYAREHTVRAFADLLAANTVVQVRGTPGSGKSCLALSLYHHLRSNGRKAILFKVWPGEGSAEDILTSACIGQGLRTTRDRVIHEDVVFIVDEAQESYKDAEFWNGVVKFQIGRGYGAQICLFCSYGSAISGLAYIDYGRTPIYFPPQNRVSLTKSPWEGSPNVCLFYNRNEYQDIVDGYCSRDQIEFVLAADAKECIYRITNGHPEATSAVLEYVRKFHRAELRRTKKRNHQGKSVIALCDILDTLNDNEKLLSHLQSQTFCRSLPGPSFTCPLHPSQRAVLHDVLKNRSIPFDERNEAMQFCVERGWVHTDLSLEGGPVCVFASPLHERFIEYIWGSYQPKPFPKTRFPTIQALCIAVLRGFSQAALGQTRDGRRIGCSGYQRPPEAAFQDEFYRSFLDLVEPGVGICSEWTGSGESRVDFLIPDIKWGVELLRDGDRLKQHCDRFKAGGAYHPWIKNGLMRDWLILDCRHSVPRPLSMSSYPCMIHFISAA